MVFFFLCLIQITLKQQHIRLGDSSMTSVAMFVACIYGIRTTGIIPMKLYIFIFPICDTLICVLC